MAERAQRAANRKNTCKLRKQLRQFYNTRAPNAHNTTKQRNALQIKLFICLCCEHLQHLLSNWWRGFLDLLVLFLFAARWALSVTIEIWPGHVSVRFIEEELVILSCDWRYLLKATNLPVIYLHSVRYKAWQIKQDDIHFAVWILSIHFSRHQILQSEPLIFHGKIRAVMLMYYAFNRVHLNAEIQWQHTAIYLTNRRSSVTLKVSCWFSTTHFLFWAALPQRGVCIK